MGRRLSKLIVAAVLASAPVSVALGADSYPSKPIRLVVPGSAGGGPDIHARKLSDKLSRAFGQPVVVDNRPGASGNIGAELVARAKPDGYTVLFGFESLLAINPALYASLPFDPLKDFAPITRGPMGYPMLLVNPQLPVRNISELVALANARPGQLMYASIGIGTFAHLAGALICARTGTQMLHVPYKNGPQAMTDLMAGQVQVAIEFAPLAQPLVQAGKLRALAILGPARKPLLPDVPTAAEAGLPDLEFRGWGGFLAPAGTPADIVAKLNRELIKAMSEQDYVDYVHDLGSEVATTTPEEFAVFMRAEAAKWAPIVKMSGAKVE
jgi:tripartite-type tricarboxylate transporter receptor subunit TctC